MVLPYLFIVFLFIGCATTPPVPPVPPASLPAGTIQHWSEHGTANTPTAEGALQISTDVRVVRHADKHLELAVDVKTENGAMFDDGTGCVRTALSQNEKEVSSFVTCSEKNPGRGISSNTVRHGHANHQIPNGITFDTVSFKFYNALHQGEPVSWNKIIAIGTALTAGM